VAVTVLSLEKSSLEEVLAAIVGLLLFKYLYRNCQPHAWDSQSHTLAAVSAASLPRGAVSIRRH
jgi:hypothetical protein